MHKELAEFDVEKSKSVAYFKNVGIKAYELLAITHMLSKELKIPLTTMEKKNKKLLFKWCDINWDAISPHLKGMIILHNLSQK